MKEWWMWWIGGLDFLCPELLDPSPLCSQNFGTGGMDQKVSSIRASPSDIFSCPGFKPLWRRNFCTGAGDQKSTSVRAYWSGFFYMSGVQSPVQPYFMYRGQGSKNHFSTRVLKHFFSCVQGWIPCAAVILVQGLEIKDITTHNSSRASWTEKNKNKKHEVWKNTHMSVQKAKKLQPISFPWFFLKKTWIVVIEKLWEVEAGDKISKLKYK